MHYYQFNIGDYASHTKGLSLLEDLAYRRLLDHYYLAEQPFNGRSTDVARLIGMRENVEEVEYVLSTFFAKDDDGNWLNTRADEEIKAYKRKSENASKAGKRSAAMRSNERSTKVEQPLNERQLTNNHKPITNNHIKDIAPPDGVLESVWKDFVKHRKTKKAAITQTALKGIEREARKADISLNDALQEICTRGWTGFKAEWVKGKSGEPDWLKAKREWYEEAAGKTPTYEKDIFDIALEEDRTKQLRIAK